MNNWHRKSMGHSFWFDHVYTLYYSLLFPEFSADCDKKRATSSFITSSKDGTVGLKPSDRIRLTPVALMKEPVGTPHEDKYCFPIQLSELELVVQK